MGAGRQKGGRRGGEEEKQKRQHPRKNRFLTSPLSSPWERTAAPDLYTRPQLRVVKQWRLLYTRHLGCAVQQLRVVKQWRLLCARHLGCAVQQLRVVKQWRLLYARRCTRYSESIPLSVPLCVGFQEIERLSEQLEEKEREAQQLLSQPGLEREKEVALLRRSVAEKERARAASHVLCRSLADETHQLRRTLAATAHMCQHLAKCLDERQGGQGTAGEQSPEPKCTEGDASVHAVVEKLREENRVLRQKVTHVEDLNARWQRYDASRDEYVRGLHAQLKGLQVPLEPELMRKEVSRLNAQLEEKMDDCAEARRELAAARSARDAALERVQMLEQQILAYKDDFTSERADRERAQSRIHELEEQVASLQRQASWRQPPSLYFIYSSLTSNQHEALRGWVQAEQ
ncbi:hypothetical protein E5288_WYG022224 [Bos mutus]|uniref:TNFAIP3-interacting protein 2 n=1 Tax=Bos mutus TaxID=72004 RepID=A0A6B0S145_9CETA|nr:hypothetical protein [Bos mutus]